MFLIFLIEKEKNYVISVDVKMWTQNNWLNLILLFSTHIFMFKWSLTMKMV